MEAPPNKYIAIHNSPRSRIIPRHFKIEAYFLESNFSPLKSIYLTPLYLRLNSLPKRNSVMIEYDGNVFFNLWLILFLKYKGNTIALDCHNSAVERQINHLARYYLNVVYLFVLNRMFSVKVIVHNHSLKLHFIRSTVLETPYPDIILPKVPNTKYEIVFCCSLNSDEPVDRILDWCNELKLNGRSVLITGDYRKVKDKYDSCYFSKKYLSYKEYIEIIAGCKLAVALSNREDTLLFSPRESIVLNTPCLVNDSKVNREFYKEKVMYVSLRDSNRKIVDIILSKCS